MTQDLIDRLVMIGVTFVGIGQSMYSTQTESLEIQKRVMMDLNDIIEIERKVKNRDREIERELTYGGYTFVLK